MKVKVHKYVAKKFESKEVKILSLKKTFSLVSKKSLRGFETELVLKAKKGKLVEGGLVITKL